MLESTAGGASGPAWSGSLLLTEHDNDDPLKTARRTHGERRRKLNFFWSGVGLLMHDGNVTKRDGNTASHFSMTMQGLSNLDASKF